MIFIRVSDSTLVFLVGYFFFFERWRGESRSQLSNERGVCNGNSHHHRRDGVTEKLGISR